MTHSTVAVRPSLPRGTSLTNSAFLSALPSIEAYTVRADTDDGPVHLLPSSVLCVRTPGYHPVPLRVVSSRYPIIQPREIAGWIDELAERTDGRVTSSTWTGREYVATVALGRVPHAPDDTDLIATVWAPYAREGAIRVSVQGRVLVCSNGLTRIASIGSARIAHTRGAEYRLQGALELVSSARSEAALYGERVQPLVSARLSEASILDRARFVASRLILSRTGDSDPEASSGLAETIIERLYAPQGQTSARKGTLYGLQQAAYDAVEYPAKDRRKASTRILHSLTDAMRDDQAVVDRAVSDILVTL